MEKKVMQLNDFLIHKQSTLMEAMGLIDKNHYGFLFIVDDNKFLGILTDGDIRRLALKTKDINAKIQYQKKCKFITLNDNIHHVIKIFKDEEISFLPILDGEHKVVNLLTKEHLHTMLLEDIVFDLNFDFLSLKKGKIENEIYSKPWGFYKSILLSKDIQSKIIHVFPDEQLSLQEHKKREEHWVVIKGKGSVVLGESKLDVYPGKYIYIPKGCKHKIQNTSKTENLIFTEVQLGEYFGEDDIIRYSDKYGRENVF